ncbi:Uncharacterised protein [Bordetella pertussis]|nr:Uncharacterised protein [Bordetella pertussis]CFT92538.1 Uncharacterised protein [Bordetella pertussis]
MAPVGLLGAFIISHLVRGVMAASSACGVSLYWVAGVAVTATGTPPLTSTMSGYDTQ